MSKKTYHVIHNGLIEGKHFNKMGIAIWTFAWLVDKVTQETTIGNERLGKVLGGKPIKHSEIAKDLNTHEKTIFNHIRTLEEGGYIRRIRTPYGHSILVRNSNKFRVTKTCRSESQKVIRHPAKSYPSNIRQYKDITVDLYKKLNSVIPSNKDKGYLDNLIQTYGETLVLRLYKRNIAFNDWDQHLQHWSGGKKDRLGRSIRVGSFFAGEASVG